jgi:hypothetical protein
MNFRQFLEAGTQGEGPSASGRRGENPVNKTQAQVKAPSLKQDSPADVKDKKKGGAMSPGTQDLKAPGSPISPRGVGYWNPNATPSPMSPGVKFQPMQPSPFSLGTKFQSPTNLKQE